MVTLRQYRPDRPEEWGEVYDVCVRTADAGRDARGLLSVDDLWGDIFAGPYLALEPELAFVLDDGERVVGYVLGTADTARWAAEHRARWLPRVAARYPRPAAGADDGVRDGAGDGGAGGAAGPTAREADLVHLLHHPEWNVHPELAAYPAHLHIDILPAHQRGGHGRALLRTFIGALAARGVPGVHLGVSPSNTAARAFYARLGFFEVPPALPDVVYLGRRTDVPL